MVPTIVLQTKKELDIYVNPRRQELLRIMQLLNRPVTPKELSRKMGISASAVQHHMHKLLEIGIVELHHTETIRGITARLYWLPPRTISLGRTPGNPENTQRLALMQNSLTHAFARFSRYFLRCKSARQEALGDMNWGILRMREDEVRELKQIIAHYIHEHEKPEAEGIAMEYALLAFPAEEDADA